jgi:hypothetical protein
MAGGFDFMKEKKNQKKKALTALYLTRGELGFDSLYNLAG